MRKRHIAPAVAVVAACGAGGALAAHPQVDPATVPTGFLTAHTRVNDIPRAAFAKGLRRGRRDVFIEHARLDPNQATGFHTHPGPVIVTVQRGELRYQDAFRGRCRTRRYFVNRGVADPGNHVHRYIAGASGADYYAVYLLPRLTGPHLTPAPAPRACAT